MTPLRHLVLLLPALLACAGASGGTRATDATAGTAAMPARLDDGWRTATPGEVGLDGVRLEALTAALRDGKYPNVHAVLIEKDGRLAYEQYFAGDDERWGTPLGRVEFDRTTRHDLRSVTKSIASALLGIALRGDTAALARPILDFFPAHADLATPERRAITLRHVLTMSAGWQWDEDIPYTDPRNDEIAMTRSPDAVRYVLSRPIVHAPGSRWTYNGGTSQLVGEVVQRVTGRKLLDYAREVLFQPLGITDVEWVGDLGGTPSAASGLRMRPRDLAKVGSLYLHDGQWNGRQVLPAQWVRESVRRHIALDTASTWGYGFQWWRPRFRTPAGVLDLPAAIGNGQQRIFVVAEHRMVVTMLAGRYNDRSAATLATDLLVDGILPAVRRQASAP